MERTSEGKEHDVDNRTPSLLSPFISTPSFILDLFSSFLPHPPLTPFKPSNCLAQPNLIALPA